MVCFLGGWRAAVTEVVRAGLRGQSREALVRDVPLKLRSASTDVASVGGVKASLASTVQAARIHAPQNHRSDGRQGRVVAALTLQPDGLCSLYMSGEERVMTWGKARELVDAAFDAVTWTDLDNGTWVARTFG